MVKRVVITSIFAKLTHCFKNIKNDPCRTKTPFLLFPWNTPLLLLCETPSYFLHFQLLHFLKSITLQIILRHLVSNVENRNPFENCNKPLSLLISLLIQTIKIFLSLLEVKNENPRKPSSLLIPFLI